MIIIKVGGGKNINWDFIASDIKNLPEKVLIVHGANATMSEISHKLNLPEKIITSPSGHVSRLTDEKTMEVLTMVYSGLVNKKIVAVLRRHSINAIGLTGADGGLWLGRRKEALIVVENGKQKVIRDSQTGNVQSVNSTLLKLLVDNGYTPVLTVPAITPGGELINVDNDRAIAVMVRDLKIRKIIMLFEAAGLLKDKSDVTSIISRIKRTDIDDYLKNAEGRMRKKLLGVKEAVSFGAKEVYFGDGRIKNPIISALSGKGTKIC